MSTNLLEKLALVIDELEDLVDDEDLSDEDFHALRPALEILEDTYANKKADGGDPYYSAMRHLAALEANL